MKDPSGASHLTSVDKDLSITATFGSLVHSYQFVLPLISTLSLSPHIFLVETSFHIICSHEVHEVNV